MKTTQQLPIQTWLILLILSFILSSCQTIDIRGQYIDDHLISQFDNKKLTKDEVLNLIGSPTIEPDYSPGTWYYIQRSLARRLWFSPQVVEQRIVKIKFNQNDQVEQVAILNDCHNDEIKFLSKYTKTYGTELNPIQKFIRNIGRFNKTTDGKTKRRK